MGEVLIKKNQFKNLPTAELFHANLPTIVQLLTAIAVRSTARAEWQSHGGNGATRQGQRHIIAMVGGYKGDAFVLLVCNCVYNEVIFFLFTTRTHVGSRPSERNDGGCRTP